MTTFHAVKGVRRITPFFTWDPAYGIYDGDYPVTNLANDELAYICRTGAGTLRANRFKGTLDRERAAMLMGFVHHTCGLYDRFRVRLYGNIGKSFTADPLTDRITCAAHGLSTGTSATVWNRTATGGALPGGLVDGTIYYVRVLDANTLTLHAAPAAASVGAGALDITSAGIGSHEMLSDLRYDSDWDDVWPVVYGDMPEWEDDNWWSGKYSEEDIAKWKIKTRPYLLDRLYLFSVATLEFDSASSIDIGLWEISKGWQFETNFAPGAQFHFRIRSKSVEHWGGGKGFERLNKPRTFRGQIAMASMTEAMEQGFEDVFNNDITEPFIWMPHPSDPQQWLRNSYFARNVDPGAPSYHQAPNCATIPLAHEEVLP
jgi:hypothetical protein